MRELHIEVRGFDRLNIWMRVERESQTAFMTSEVQVTVATTSLSTKLLTKV